MNTRPQQIFTKDVICMFLTTVVVVESLYPFVRGDSDRTAWTNEPPSSAKATSLRGHGNADQVARNDSLLLKALSKEQVFETKPPADTEHKTIVRDGDHVMILPARPDAGQDNLSTEAQVLKVNSNNVKSNLANSSSPETDTAKVVDVKKDHKLLSVLMTTQDENRRFSKDLLQKSGPGTSLKQEGQWSGPGASLKQEGQWSATETMPRLKDMESPSHVGGEHVESQSAIVKIMDTLNVTGDDKLAEAIVGIFRGFPRVELVRGGGYLRGRMRKFLEEYIKGPLGDIRAWKVPNVTSIYVKRFNEIMNQLEISQDKTAIWKFFKDEWFLPKIKNVVKENLPENNVKTLPEKLRSADVNNGTSILSGVRAKREESRQVGSGEAQGESTAFPRPGSKQVRVQSPGKSRDGIKIGYLIFPNSNQVKESKEISLSDLHGVNATGSVWKLNLKYPVKCNHLPGAHVPDYGHQQDKTPKPDMGLQGDGARHHEDTHLLGNERSPAVQNSAQSNMGASGDGHPITSGEPKGLDSKKEPSIKKGIEQSIIEILSLKAKVDDNAKTDKQGELMEFYQSQGQQSARELRRHHHAASVSATHILLIMAICVFTFVTVMYLSSRFRSDSDSAKRVNSQTALFEQQPKYDKY